MSSSYLKRAQLKMKSEAWGSRVSEKAQKQLWGNRKVSLHLCVDSEGRQAEMKETCAVK